MNLNQPQLLSRRSVGVVDRLFSVLGARSIHEPFHRMTRPARSANQLPMPSRLSPRSSRVMSDLAILIPRRAPLASLFVC
jgi:hypothetical protein